MARDLLYDCGEQAAAIVLRSIGLNEAAQEQPHRKFNEDLCSKLLVLGNKNEALSRYSQSANSIQTLLGSFLDERKTLASAVHLKDLHPIDLVSLSKSIIGVLKQHNCLAFEYTAHGNNPLSADNFERKVYDILTDLQALGKKKSLT